MMQASLLRRPGLFLGLFALVTALSLPVWDVLSAYYMRGVIWIVNGGLTLLAPVNGLRLPTAMIHAGVYPGIAGAIALFLVTPHRGWRWKLRWIAALMAVMLVVHAGVLLAETMSAIHGTLQSPALPLRLLHTWGTSTVVIWIWFIAVRRRRHAANDLQSGSRP